MSNILEVKDLNVSYGGIKAVKEISFQVPKGQVVTLIGANGAGKSSTLRSIVGLVKPESGSIRFKDTELAGLSTDQIVSTGITPVPEGRRVFRDLTVLENLKIGAYMRKDSLDEDLNWVHELFPRLKERSWQLAGTLSGGEQQMLAIGRALMSRPELIMMDEPSLGLAPIIVQGVFDIIREINRQGVTILLVEQNANMALKAADLGCVMETGRITLRGTGKELSENEEVSSMHQQVSHKDHLFSRKKRSAIAMTADAPSVICRGNHRTAVSGISMDSVRLQHNRKDGGGKHGGEGRPGT